MEEFIPIREYAEMTIAPACEIIVLVICITFYLLLDKSYISKTESFRYIKMTFVILYISSTTRLVMYMLIASSIEYHFLIYILRSAYYIGISFCSLLYAVYLKGPLRLKQTFKFKFEYVGYIALALTILIDIVLSITKAGFYITENNMAHNTRRNTYIIFCCIIFLGINFNIFRSKSRIPEKSSFCLMITGLLPLVMIFLQNFWKNQFFMSFSIIIPAFALILMFHTGSYDLQTNSVAVNVFYNQLQNALDKNKTCFIFCGYIRSLSNYMTVSQEFRDSYQNFFVETVRDGMISLLDSEHIAIAYIKKNKELNSEAAYALQNFHKNFDSINMEYKLISLETDPLVRDAKSYGDILKIAESKIVDGQTYRITKEDYEKYTKRKYIYEQLSDIYNKSDLDDPRVLVYCQPVRNVKTNSYDTAESLMRLRLEKYGMIFPDEFIPMAEETGFIHVLTMILLNKVCESISVMVKEGYNISRISINLSVHDIEKEALCMEITQIIENNFLEASKIAVEITESKLIKNMDLIKSKILYFHEIGIQLYLDDFGTGYSNFERIMELPFDIIKFDRSLVIEASKTENNRFMVKSFAEMFHCLNYALLYEGIEDEVDEMNCISMNAAYLQGYKYSKPIPIDELKRFLTKI